MRRTLTAAALLLVAATACSPAESGGTARPPASGAPAATTAPSSPPASGTPNFDKFNKDLACFEYGTYAGAAHINNPKTLQYALEARQAAAKVADPRWSALADQDPEQAMTQLAALCKEAHLPAG